MAGVFQNRLFGPLGMKDTSLPASTSNTIPEPYSHGYLYGSSSYALVDAPYPADLQAAAKAGPLKPNDDTGQNPSYATAAGGVISKAAQIAHLAGVFRDYLGYQRELFAVLMLVRKDGIVEMLDDDRMGFIVWLN